MSYFVRSGGLLGFSEWVRDNGENPNMLMAEVGLSPAALYDSDLYIPYLALARLMTVSAQRCQREDFGIRLGMRQGLEAVGALGSAMCLQANLGDALRLMQRNLEFHARGVLIAVNQSERWLELSMDFAFATEEDCDQLAGLSLALLCRCLQQLQGVPSSPAALELRNGTAEPGVYRELFGCEPVVDTRRNCLIYPIELLAEPVLVAADLRARLSQQWQSSRQRPERDLQQQLEKAITALLPTGECNLAMVARIVDLHPRVLQQRLAAQGSSFSALLESRRLRLAKEHLAHSDIDLTTLALNLGYAELAVFSRAFKRWQGVSPRAWRRQQQADRA
ncbi:MULTISPECIES: AraC family transcriptional regulator [Spongiibacter]|uniref:AraC family transcriptional regulator n=1 Tax=Spongiibacter TaxID=630749 RepID=UPI001AFFDF76|nr:MULTISPECIES: AraC family transcriptional regulator [Spongiibacter]MBO6752827.1 AraC family transcriptional regulator ligand-binding domain-containing protein [Spongiibacter sp.]